MRIVQLITPYLLAVYAWTNLSHATCLHDVAEVVASGSNGIPNLVRDARAAGLVCLLHKTKLETLPAIIKSRALVAGTSATEKPPIAQRGAGNYTYGFDTVFLSLATKNQAGKSLVTALSSTYGYVDGVEFGNLTNAVLVFRHNLIDRSDYHVTRGIAYGQRTHTSVEPDGVVQFVQEQVKEGYDSNEIVFQHSIPLAQNLVEIWVHPQKYEETLRLIRDAGIDLKDYPEVRIVPKATFPEHDFAQ